MEKNLKKNAYILDHFALLLKLTYYKSTILGVPVLA